MFIVRFTDGTEQAFMGPINLGVVERASKGVPAITAGTLGELQDGHGHWGNRGALLRAYRELLTAMALRGFKIERSPR